MMAEGDADGDEGREVIRGPLTFELASAGSPVRKFLDSRFTHGLRDVQRHYRETAQGIVVPAADRQDVNPGTLGAAADWLLRFLLYPAPSLRLAALGATLCGPRTGMVEALAEIAGRLSLDRDALRSAGTYG